MAIQAINEIKKAEEKAKELINEALSRKNTILKEAEKEAEEKYNSIIKAAHVQSTELINIAIKEGEEESTPIYEDGKSEVENILNVDRSKMDKAVNLIIEKVVNVNGNS